MLTVLGLAAQLTVASGSGTYANPAVERLVEAASAVNGRIPSTLAAYTARAEGEASNVWQLANGREFLWGGAEQYAWRASWSRQHYELHLVGRRGNPLARKTGIGAAQPWLIPHLYGERFPVSLPLQRQSESVRSPIHPFAANATLVYTYSGGDTVAQIETGGRRIQLVVVHVTPRADIGDESVFDGDVFLDGSRYQIVRLVGRFKLRASTASLEVRLDIEDAEVDGEFWLPHKEKLEMELRSPLLLTPYVSRLVATIDGYAVTRGSDSVRYTSAESIIETKARGDSVDTFSVWQHPLTSFDPDAFDDFVDRFSSVGGRTTSFPSIRVGVSRPANAVHYNRVEGLFTGTEVTIVPGPVAFGWLMRAQAGYAWVERTFRGSLTVERQRDRSMIILEGRRAIVSTSDFPPSETLAMLSEVFPLARLDYVDRSALTGRLTRLLSESRRTFVSLSAGIGRDHDALARTRGMFGTDSAVIPDRFATTGAYGIMMVDAGAGRTNPVRTLANSIGTSLHLETAAGGLRWVRATGLSQLRLARSRMAYSARIDGGAVFSPSLPPQQLFELGGSDRLPGYDYKQFVGDRAFLASGTIEFPLTVRRYPGRQLERRGIPPVAPAVAIGIQGGWTELSKSGQASVALLTRQGTLPTPTITNGVVGSGGLGITLFSGAIHAGIARPLEAARSWRPAIGFSSTF